MILSYSIVYLHIKSLEPAATDKRHKIMKTISKEEIIAIGNKLANANLVVKYAARSHSHNIYSLFPQTEAQYNWLKRTCGTTSNVVLTNTVDEVLSVCPEVANFISKTKSGRFCRINISL